ncbi:MAG: glycosyltransferase [Nitriliruptorales bacterium]|nr:glycosyltransferase [Nitriliruptorales bacterium]
MTAGSDLTVVVPTHRRPEILDRTLTALASQSVGGFETIVVVDGAGEVPAGHDVTVVEQAHAGPGAARNNGASRSRRPLLLFLGDDMIPTPNLVAEHLRWHERRPDDRVAVLGHVDWHPSVASSALHRWLDWSSTQFDYVNLAGLAGSDVGFGRFYSCNVSLKRSLYERVGGFDEDFVMYYEDLDMGWRLAEEGLELVYEPAALVHHLHDYDLAGIRRRFEGIALGERIMAHKHPWFEPWFRARVEAALAKPSVGWAGRVATHIVDRAPAIGGLGTRLERAANRWYLEEVGPAYLEQWERAEAVTELMDYLGEDFEGRGLISGAEDVDREAAAAPDELTFYRTSRAYLYDLTVFELSPTKDPYLDALRSLIGPGARILDYGCGIGSDGLRLLAEGYDVAFADFDNPSTEYLRWRLARRGSDATVYDVENDEIPPGFELAYSFDVIEHVADPIGFLERMEAVADVVLVNLLEEDEHDHDHDLHHDLPIDEIVARAESRGLLARSLHHGRSHLLAWRGRSADS